MADRGGERVNPKLTLAVLSLAGVAYAVLSSAVVPALPTIQHSLHASETGITWLLTGYLLSASVGTAILGRLGDMYGKQHVLVWTLVVLAGGTLMAALSHSLALLMPPASSRVWRAGSSRSPSGSCGTSFRVSASPEASAFFRRSLASGLASASSPAA